MVSEPLRRQRRPHVQSAAEQLLEAVPRLMDLIAGEAQADGMDGSLTVTQLRVLGLLRRSERLPSELARELRITPATASEVVDLLVRRGLVARSEVPHDRRLTVLHITPAGASRLEAARARAVAGLQRLASQLSAGELAALQRGLAGLLAVLPGKPQASRRNNYDK